MDGANRLGEPVTKQSTAAPEALVVHFLRWVAAESRACREAIKAWRTSCPRLTVWEDAFDRKLVARLVSADGPHVVLTDAGRRLVDSDTPLQRRSVSFRRPCERGVNQPNRIVDPVHRNEGTEARAFFLAEQYLIEHVEPVELDAR